jgi:hypothetical protein
MHQYETHSLCPKNLQCWIWSKSTVWFGGWSLLVDRWTCPPHCVFTLQTECIPALGPDILLQTLQNWIFPVCQNIFHWAYVLKCAGEMLPQLTVLHTVCYTVTISPVLRWLKRLHCAIHFMDTFWLILIFCHQSSMWPMLHCQMTMLV